MHLNIIVNILENIAFIICSRTLIDSTLMNCLNHLIEYRLISRIEMKYQNTCLNDNNAWIKNQKRQYGNTYVADGRKYQKMTKQNLKNSKKTCIINFI